jgi:hypothetical protein
MLQGQEDAMSVRGGRGWSAAMRSWLSRGVDDEGRELELGRDATWSARIRGSAVEVRCSRGLLLVTVEGDVDDHVLEEGEAFVTTRRGRLAVWALEAARVRVRKRSGLHGSESRPETAPAIETVRSFLVRR